MSFEADFILYTQIIVMTVLFYPGLLEIHDISSPQMQSGSIIV